MEKNQDESIIDFKRYFPYFVHNRITALCFNICVFYPFNKDYYPDKAQMTRTVSRW
jgi:hypothetical protein